jgi:hypothetical protein
MRKSSGGERARFLEEESEPRTKMVFLAGENHRADVLACLTAPSSSKTQSTRRYAPQMDRDFAELRNLQLKILLRGFGKAFIKMRRQKKRN